MSFMKTREFDAIIPAPFGAVGVRTEDDFLVGLELLPSAQPEKIAGGPFVQSVVSQIKQYLNNPDTLLDIPIAVKGTPFQKRVWKAIADVPVGQTIYYSDLARVVGSGPRAVANVCGANQVPLVIPCHRIVAKNGLGGFMQGQENGLAVKVWLLQHEQRQ
jgi:methylated-DNA-[protein]-cysteine S-methyltransferase